MKEIVCVASGGPRISVYEYRKQSQDNRDDVHDFKLLSEASPSMINVSMATPDDALSD